MSADLVRTEGNPSQNAETVQLLTFWRAMHAGAEPMCIGFVNVVKVSA